MTDCDCHGDGTKGVLVFFHQDEIHTGKCWARKAELNASQAANLLRLANELREYVKHDCKDNIGDECGCGLDVLLDALRRWNQEKKP